MNNICLNNNCICIIDSKTNFKTIGKILEPVIYLIVCLISSTTSDFVI